VVASQPRSQAVGVVRADTSGHFWLDFVVCLSHFDGAEPQARVIETKENVKDAARKARHAPNYRAIRITARTYCEDRVQAR
jgi:hypothetical protein